MAVTRLRRVQVTGHETIRPSVQWYLDTGDRSRMDADNAWMRLDFPFVAILEAHRAGNHLRVRELLAAVPGAAPGFYLR